MAALLFLSFPAGFSRDATAGDSAGDFKKLTSCWSIFPKRVPPSFCSLFVYWVFMLLYIYLLTCLHSSAVSVGAVVCLLGWDVL